jgi:hypothetical protein
MNAIAGPPTDEITDRTNVITARLKTIYRKVVLPVEQRYKYDYFYESPFLSDVEFDGRCHSNDVERLQNFKRVMQLQKIVPHFLLFICFQPSHRFS